MVARKKRGKNWHINAVKRVKKICGLPMHGREKTFFGAHRVGEKRKGKRGGLFQREEKWEKQKLEGHGGQLSSSRIDRTTPQENTNKKRRKNIQKKKKKGNPRVYRGF